MPLWLLFHCPRVLSLEFPNTGDDFLLDGMFGIWAFSLNTVSVQDVSSFVLEVIFHHLFSPQVLAPWAFLPSCCWPCKYYVPGELLGRRGRGLVTLAVSAKFFPIQGTLQGISGGLCPLQREVSF